MNYIVLDLEWNQRASPKIVKTKPIYLSGEIIQFGAVKLDAEFNIVSTYTQLVKPNFYKKIHWSVAKLTKINADDLFGFGLDFPKAVDEFFEWCGQNPVFFTWGPDDIPMLRSNLIMYGMSTDNLEKSYDLQPIFDSQISHLSRQLALSDALAMVNEEELTAHDALNDAINTTTLFKHLDMEKGLREYKQAVNLDNLPILLNNDFIFENISVMRSSEKIVNFACPVCGADARRENWVDSGKGRKLSLANCDNGHKFLLRLKFKKIEEEKMSAVRSVFALDDELLEFFREKEEKYNARLEKYYRKVSKGKNKAE